jgi:hypothetical protein
MSYPQQPGGGWNDQSWPYDPNQPASGTPASPAGYQGGYDTPVYPAQQPAYPVQQQYPVQQYPVQQQYPAYGYGAPVLAPSAPTNGLAIASLVVSLAGLFTCGLTSIVGAILGHVARKQIRERGDGGDGLALAGIITGWIIFGLAAIGIAIYVIFFILLVATAASVPTYDPTPYFPTPTST